MAGSIWVSPVAFAGSPPAITSGIPALSRNTIPSSVAGSIAVPVAAASIWRWNAATRRAVAIAPPGLLANSDVRCARRRASGEPGGVG